MEVKIVKDEVKVWQRTKQRNGFSPICNESFIAKPSSSNPLLNDNSEFPSLSSSSGKYAEHSCSSRIKYSDKLKNSFIPGKVSDPVNTKLHCAQPTSSAYMLNTSEVQKSGNQDVFNKKSPSHVINENARLSQLNFTAKVPKKNLSGKHSSINSVLTNAACSSICDDNVSRVLRGRKNDISKSNTSGSCNKSKTLGTTCVKNAKVNEENSYETKVKKKRNRKSKVKRQVEFQTGKISILTPEVHSKIIGKSIELSNVSSLNTVAVDIHNEKEYPELGKSFQLVSKEELPKKEILSEPAEFIGKSSNEEDKAVTSSSISSVNLEENKIVDKKEKNCDKVHPNNPITVSLYDALFPKSKGKGRDVKETKAPEIKSTVSSVKSNKTSFQPHNLLDSCPVIKRGKERETPKAKKPSQLKKIILMDRKARKELLLKNCVNTDKLDNNESHDSEDSENILSIYKNDQTTGNSIKPSSLEEKDESLPLNSEFYLSGENYIEDLTKLDKIKISESNENVLESNFTYSNGQNSSSQKVFKNCNASVIHKMLKPSSEENLEFESCNNSNHESTTFILKDFAETKSYSERERAAKVVLHTRHFREYCNHLISEDIDNFVYALLDDLARFQDRLHQKDPVKAKMKRRMIYGIKDIKKHIKLKKLKCIIIATDIENIETEGGLNDILKDMKLLAAEHHIPCVFSLSRKVIGKICHKPVPVSCVGIFNYEGSETNFKKIIELQDQSKKDYIKMLQCLIEQLTEEESFNLLKAKKENPEKLHDLKSEILRRIFFTKSCTSEMPGVEVSQVKDLEK